MVTKEHIKKVENIYKIIDSMMYEVKKINDNLQKIDLRILASQDASEIKKYIVKFITAISNSKSKAEDAFYNTVKYLGEIEDTKEKKYRYCKSCKTNTPHKDLPTKYFRESMQNRFQNKCLKCGNIHTTWI